MLPDRLAKNGVGGGGGGGGGGLFGGGVRWGGWGGGGGGGGSRDFFLVVEPNFSSNRTVGLFCGKLLLTETTTCFSICERQQPIGYPKTIFCNIPGIYFSGKIQSVFH